MPELPEVEVTRRGLADIVGRRVSSLIVGDEMLLGEGFGNENSRKSVGDQFIRSVSRRGKYCLLTLKEKTLLFSLRMTGNLTAEATVGNDLDSYVAFDLNQGFLLFSSVRRFSRVHRYETTDFECIPKVSRLGPDPFHDPFSVDMLRPRLENRTAPVKSLLMNQEIVAGLGNIYANESCYSAGIDPRRSVKSLEDDELTRLLGDIVDVLETAVDLGGSTINDFRGPDGENGKFQDNFFVYGREEEGCARCDGTIRKTNLAGRSTFFCPACQE